MVRRDSQWWMTAGVYSSYSYLVRRRYWKVSSDTKMNLPIQTEYVLSEAATTLSWSRPCFRTTENKATGVECYPHTWQKRHELSPHRNRNSREYGGPTGHASANRDNTPTEDPADPLGNSHRSLRMVRTGHHPGARSSSRWKAYA